MKSRRKPVDASVKSGQRVLKILEYFDISRPEATITAIAQELGYPISSTAALVHTLVHMGYLLHDNKKRIFRLSPFVPLLGAWVQPELYHSGKLHRMMEEIYEATGQLVAIVMRVGPQTRILYARYKPGSVPKYLTLGRGKPLLTTLWGKVLLSSQPEPQLRALVRSINADAPSLPRISPSKFVQEMKEIQKAGYGLKLDADTMGRAQLAMLLPDPILVEGGKERLVIGISSDPAELEKHWQEWLGVMRKAISDYVAAYEPDEV